MVRVNSDDLVRAAAAELYAADPDQFVERRGELAAQARRGGQAAAAKQITGMRKPTRSAWVINQLVRAQPEVVTELAGLGRELRAAQRTLDGAAIRELSRRRRQLLGTLVRQAFGFAGVQAAPTALRAEVAATLGAALNDAQVANQLAEGALVRAARSEGFGSTGPELTLVPQARGRQSAAGERKPAAAGERQRAAARRSGKAALAAVPSAQPAGPDDTGPDDTGPAAGRKPEASARAPAQVTPAQRAAARKKAEQQQRRDAIAAAERALAAADRAAETASRAEQEQEAAVLRLEGQLADARRQLAETRLRARRARTGQRQARLAAERLRR
jgi:hypothetical protein